MNHGFFQASEIIMCYPKEKGSVLRINAGVIQHGSLMKNGIALRLCIPGMLGKSYHRAKDGVSRTTLMFSH